MIVMAFGDDAVGALTDKLFELQNPPQPGEGPRTPRTTPTSGRRSNPTQQPPLWPQPQPLTCRNP
jgi:hypothetical protein